MRAPRPYDRTVTIAPIDISLDHSFAEALPELCVQWTAAAVAAPQLVALNEQLAAEIGIDPAVLRTDLGVAMLVGTAPPGVQPVAQAYAGHQFGGFSPRLGDGRALLLGEVVDVDGRRRDVHLKGSGRTPFSRGGDGKAALGPMLREYLMGEAMHALGIPTTRALAVVGTGERVLRETELPGAVLVRVAASHIRVGTFQYAAATGDVDVLRRLADHVIARHHPDVDAGRDRYLALLDRVVGVQADLIAKWMLVGFIHGVMNTDNMTVSGETIDYGPCAFMDHHDAATVFSSIDHGGRYAYGNQPNIAVWNLARLAEAMLPLFDDDQAAAVTAATSVLETFAPRYEERLQRGMARKLGLGPGDHADVVASAGALLQERSVDHTSFFRALARLLRGGRDALDAVVGDAAAVDAWLPRWEEAITTGGRDPRAVADAMDRENPLYIPRNHKVEEALTAATDGDLTPFDALVDVVRRPFDERAGLDEYARPAPPSAEPYRTFCGT
jgi:uncharacterized protein YdiU (UPF0061 family)